MWLESCSLTRTATFISAPPLRNAPYGSDKNSSYVYAEFQLYAKDAAGLDTTYIGASGRPPLWKQRRRPKV